MNKEKLVSVQVLGRYDGTAYWLDPETNKRYSRETYQLLQEDELCKPGVICKVEQTGPYDYKILSSRNEK